MAAGRMVRSVIFSMTPQLPGDFKPALKLTLCIYLVCLFPNCPKEVIAITTTLCGSLG